MPKIQLEAYHHPREHLYAVLYDAAGQSILDLIGYDHDGKRLTVTNNTTPPETHFDMPDRRTIRLSGAPPAELLQAIRAEPEPPGGVAPAPAIEFVERFQDAYRRRSRPASARGVASRFEPREPPHGIALLVRMEVVPWRLSRGLG
jgi:hypothetical protein